MEKFNTAVSKVFEEYQEETAYTKLNNFLKEKGLETADLFTVERFIGEICKEYVANLNKVKTPFK